MSGNTTRRIWVTGAGGLIGNALVRQLRGFPQLSPVIGLTREECDLTQPESIRERYLRDAPDILIHCAAISRPTDCDQDPALARLVNVEATRHLVELHRDRPFVFLSTDVVFDGSKGNYREDAPLCPLSLYGETKALGEAIVARNPASLIVRTSLNGGRSPTGDRGFNEQMELAWQAGQSLKLFTDEFRTPIAADVTASAIIELLVRDCRGVVHIAGGERMSRWELGRLLAERRPDLSPKLEAGSLRDYSGPPRSPDCCLNIDHANGILSQPLPRFSDWLRERPLSEF